jgi:hypothetical protein
VGGEGAKLEGFLAGAVVVDAVDEQGDRVHLGSQVARVSLVGDDVGEGVPIRGELRNHQLRYRKGQTLRPQCQKDLSPRVEAGG